MLLHDSSSYRTILANTMHQSQAQDHLIRPKVGEGNLPSQKLPYIGVAPAGTQII
jgi:hypothetical protein